MTVRHFGEASAFSRREKAAKPDRRLWEDDRSSGPAEGRSRIGSLHANGYSITRDKRRSVYERAERPTRLIRDVCQAETPTRRPGVLGVPRH
jgi:hypothetical protein